MANFSHVKNGTFYVLDMYNGSDSIVLFHTKNIASVKVFNIGAVYTPTWFRVWSPTFSVNLTKPYITYMAQKHDKPICYFEFDNMLELPHNFMLGMDMNYNTAGDYDADLSYQVPDFGLDAYCIKTFLKGRLRIKLSISNAFNTSREKWSKSTNGISLYKWRDSGRRTLASLSAIVSIKLTTSIKESILPKKYIDCDVIRHRVMSSNEIQHFGFENKHAIATPPT